MLNDLTDHMAHVPIAEKPQPITIDGYKISDPGDPSRGKIPQSWEITGKFTFATLLDRKLWEVDLQVLFKHLTRCPKITPMGEIPLGKNLPRTPRQAMEALHTNYNTSDIDEDAHLGSLYQAIEQLEALHPDKELSVIVLQMLQEVAPRAEYFNDPRI